MLDMTRNGGLLLRRGAVLYGDRAIDADRVHVRGSHHELRYTLVPSQNQEHISVLGNVTQHMCVIATFHFHIRSRSNGLDDAFV